MGFKGSIKGAIGAAVTALAAVVVLLPTASHAEQVGSYTSNPTGVVPRIYYPRTVYNSPNFITPADIPSDATITSISGRLGFDLQPNAMWWTAWICADAANTQCAPVSPTGSFKYNAGWNYSTTAFAGWPATTQFHFAIILQDGKSGSIIPALNPALYTRTQTATVNYTSPDPLPAPGPEPSLEPAR